MESTSTGDEPNEHPNDAADTGHDSDRRERHGRWTYVRSAGFLVLAIAAIAVYLQGAPEIEDHSDALASALLDEQVNAAGASSAPQQQVLNGWVARDLLTVIAEQLEAATERDNRPVALLTLVVLGLAWHGLVPRATRTTTRTAA